MPRVVKYGSSLRKSWRTGPAWVSPRNPASGQKSVLLTVLRSGHSCSILCFPNKIVCLEEDGYSRLLIQRQRDLRIRCKYSPGLAFTVSKSHSPFPASQLLGFHSCCLRDDSTQRPLGHLGLAYPQRVDFTPEISERAAERVPMKLRSNLRRHRERKA